MLDTITLPPKTWTLLTSGVAQSALRAHNLGDAQVDLMGMATLTEPSSNKGAQPLYAHKTLAADLPLADLFPHLGSPTMHVYGYSEEGSMVSMSHA